MLLGDAETCQNPQDPFKKVYVAQKHKTNVAEKALTRSFYHPKSERVASKQKGRKSCTKRWSEQEMNARSKSNFFDGS